MTTKITIIEGDGIGPEVMNSAKEVLSFLDNSFIFEEELLGLKAIEKFGVTLPEKTLFSIKENKVALKGPTTTPVGTGHKSANVALRKALDLYACIRPVKTFFGIDCKFTSVDLVIFRENTEGLYAGLEFEVSPDVMVSLRTITKKASIRIAKKAFSFAKKNNRKKVYAIHKANILKLSDGLFLNCIRNIRKEFSDIEYEECIVDALCMKLAIAPERFDVLILENMFGDIVSDLCAGLVGGLGVVGGANIGDGIAVFEAVHGTAPDIAGLNLANPTGILLSLSMMLKHLDRHDLAKRLDLAIKEVLKEKTLRTKDLGGHASTKEFTKNIIRFL